MKKFVSILLLVCLILSAITVFAHPGDTDSDGGHYDRQNGGYHYHHGYPAHQHKGGNCPYISNHSSEINPISLVFAILLFLCLMFLYLFPMIAPLLDKNGTHKEFISNFSEIIFTILYYVFCFPIIFLSLALFSLFHPKDLILSIKNFTNKIISRIKKFIFDNKIGLINLAIIIVFVILAILICTLVIWFKLY